MPLALAAIAQTHALLVGYLDLSVGAMISFGVVVGSFLIGGDASTVEILIGVAAVVASRARARVGQRRADQGLQDPVAHRHAGHAQHPRRDLADHATHRPGRHQRRPRVGAAEEHRADPDRVPRSSSSAPACSISGCTPRVRVSRCARSASTSGRRSAAASGPTGSGCARSCSRACLAAVAAFFVMARSPIGNAQIGSSLRAQQHHRRRAGRGGALRRAGDVRRRAPWPPCCWPSIITALPFLDLSPTDGSMIIGFLVLVGIVLFQVGDLKELVKRNFRRARRLALGSRIAERAAIPNFYAEGVDFAVRADGSQADQERDRPQPRPADRRGQRLRRADRRRSNRRRRASAWRRTAPRSSTHRA